MKKPLRFLVVTVMIALLGMINIAEARKGQTSSDSTKTSTSRSRSSSSSSSYSKPSKSSTRSTSNSFVEAAKTKQAKTAWQDYQKKNVEPTPAPVSLEKNTTRDLEQELADLKAQVKSEKKRKKADKLAQQLAAIEKQIASAKRQQQLIAIAQTAAQAAMNKQRQPYVTNSPYNGRTTVPTPVVNPAVVNTTKPVPTNKSGGGWGVIFLIVGVVVIVLLWRSRGNNTTTNYRL